MTTKTNAHTPGPWIANGHAVEQAETDKRKETYVIAFLRGSGFDDDRDVCEVDANARLIAAAPDLLAAAEQSLQSCKNWACNCGIGGEGQNNPAAVAVRNLEAAIRKAKGKS